MYQIFFLHPTIPSFPEPDDIRHLEEDIICFGGKLSAEWLLEAYPKGFFPWFNPDNPPMWWNPNPRALMRPREIRIHKSMRPYINQVKYHLRIDSAFEQLMLQARQTHTQQDGSTWITEEFIREYTRLHQMGLAHSFEAWQDGKLVGGLYGVSLGKFFFGEAMFSQRPNASKFCFIALARTLEINGFNYIDCQIQNPHLRFMGCGEVARNQFLDNLTENKQFKTLSGNWSEMLRIPPELEKHFVP